MPFYFPERFPDWLEEKTDLPIFEDFPPVDPASQTVLEFQTLCNDSVGKIQSEIIPQLYHLTPPQSPPQLLPHPTESFIPIWQPMPVPVDSSVTVIDELVLDAVQNIAWQEPNNNVELEEMRSVNYIEEFELPQSNSEESSYSDSNVPCEITYVPYNSSSGGSSPASCSPNSPSSSSCSAYGSSENDEEWVLTPSKSKARSNRRSKPYSHSDDKKSRKKEQNKNAATRYRQKKKAEIEVLMAEEQELQTVNDNLSSQYDDIRKQVSCLKKFLREVFEAKKKLASKN